LLPTSLVQEDEVIDQHIRAGRFQRSLLLVTGVRRLLAGLEVPYQQWRENVTEIDSGAAAAVVAALEKLDDETLCAVIARAQGLLLDRPISSDGLPALTVEIVGREENGLLAAYRTLAPPARRRLLAGLRRPPSPVDLLVGATDRGDSLSIGNVDTTRDGALPDERARRRTLAVSANVKGGRRDAVRARG